MNRVFSSQLHRGRGLLPLGPLDKKLLAAAAASGYLAANAVAAVAAAVATTALLQLHRRLDNWRLDHLELLARRLGLLALPRWSLCERDSEWRRYEWR